MRRAWYPALLAACVAGLWWLSAPWRAGFPVGSDWHQYLYSAHAAAGTPEAAALIPDLPDWRSPIYPWLLGCWPGADGAGRIAAAQQIAGASMAAALLASAGLARRLSGAGDPDDPGAGGAGEAAGLLAAGLLLGLPVVQAGSAWMNPYPLLAGLCAGAVWAGARSERAASGGFAGGFSGWRAGAWAGLAGLLGGLALAADGRGAVGLAGAGLGGMAGWSAARAGGRAGWLAAAQIGAPFAAMAAVGPLLERALRLREAMPLAEQVAEQRQFSLIELAGREGVRCADAGAGGIGMLVDGCAPLLRASGFASLQALGAIPAGGWAALAVFLLAGLLLPEERAGRAGGGWLRSVMAAVAAGGLPLAALWGGASLVLFRDRYLLPLLPLLVAAGAAGSVRLAGLIARQWWARAALAAGLWALIGWQVRAQQRVEPDLPSARGQAAWAQIRARMQPGDRAMDCAGLGLEALALPERWHAGPVNLAGIHVPSCEEFARGGLCGEPGGGAGCWLITAEGPSERRLRLEGSGWRLAAVLDAPTVPSSPAVRIWERRAAGLELQGAPQGP